MSANERNLAVQQTTGAEVTAADLGRTKSRNHQHQQQQQQQFGGGGSRRCARCEANLGRFYNTGAVCPRCRHRVCRHCREHQKDEWLCSLCHKLQDLRSVSAEWKHRASGRDNNYWSALDILKYSIRRAWTINGPPARWSTARKSAEYRLYRSLPNARRRDFLDEKNFKNITKRSSAEPLTAKPPKVVGKTITKPSDSPKKSSIPVFRSRNSREFEDLRSPHESPKRSLIPQRYRNSTDDLRRGCSREDISQPSFIPKLLSPVQRADKLKRQDSRDDVRKQNTAGIKTFLRRDEASSCDSAITGPLPSDAEPTRKECALTSQNVTSPEAQSTMKMPHEKTTGDNNYDRRKTSGGGTRNEVHKALQISGAGDTSTTSNVDAKNEDEEVNVPLAIDNDKLKTAEETEKKTDDNPPVVKRKFSKEEFSNDDTDDTHNRRCSSHFSPEASPLSTRSSKYSPRESESEPTPALPRKVTNDRGESSSASQRIRDAITRTRRESNSSAKYESSGSESVSRLGEPGLSSYVDIARRVKFFGSGSIGASTGSCDEILQRDSATSAGEDDHDDRARDPMRLGPNSQRVMLRRRRQFDTQGPRRRGRSRACCGEEHHHLQGLHQVVDEDHQQGLPALLDYRRLVFISSDSSSGREEDDADSSCSGSSYLNLQSGGCGLEDCDWDYFESNSLKLPQLQPHEHRSLTCCPARPSTSGCCQTCGGSKNAKVLPVPVPVPIPVPYLVPVPASIWTGDLTGRAAAAAASSMISRDAVTQSALSLRGCDPSTGWFTWNPKFDSNPNLLFSENNIFPGEVSASANDLLQQPEKEEKTELGPEIRDKVEPEIKADKETEDLLAGAPQGPPEEENDPDQKVQQPARMFHQDQDSRSSSGRSSADSSDLEDSAVSHRFSRVMIVNDDSLTSDNDIEDNEDSDSARESRPAALKPIDCIPENDQDKDTTDDSVVLKMIRHFDEESYLVDYKSEASPVDEDKKETDEQKDCDKKPQKEFNAHSDEIASYDEIYLASNQEDSENIVLLKSVKSIDPESYGQSNSNFVPGFKAFPKQPDCKQEVVLASNVCNNDENDDDSSDDSAVMPDSLEVSIQDLEDSIEARNTSPTSTLACDIGRALLAASSPVEGKSNNLRSAAEEEEATSPTTTVEGGEEEEEEEKQLTTTASSTTSSSGALTSTTSSSDELHEYSVSCTQAQEAAYMAKTRKKWQIPASFDIKGLPSTHFLPPERKKDTAHSLSPLLSAAEDIQLQPEEPEYIVHHNPDNQLQDEENANGYQEHEYVVREENERGRDESSSSYSSSGERVRGSSAAKQVGVNERLLPPPSQPRTPTNNDDPAAPDDDYEEEEDEEETMLPTLPPGRRDWANNLCSLSQLNNINNNTNGAAAAAAAQLGNNKYRSLVMITQNAYQPVNVITSDTTTLMQPQLSAGGYYQKDADPGQDGARRNLSHSLNKKPLPCKRLLPEPEVDSGLSVGSASESDDVSVKNASKQASRSPSLFVNREDETAQDYPSFDSAGQKRQGPLILEEGLADDDSWVEEISHDEDEASMTTATEESSEDEAANNLGDREEELRGYHRQAIDFTLHTIVEESCEESESEHASANWRRRLASASAPDLNRYLFFGVGADGNSSRELDSLSETSSILSEGLDSLTREESSQNAGVTEISNTESSKRSDKSYFLSDFLGADQDRRDSDGSVGSDSEGRPSPEAQRRKRLVRARGTGRSHSSSLDNLLALTHNSNSGSHQNSLQDISHPGTDGQESQSEGSSTETDAAEENQTSSAFSPDGQFDTVKRKKKKMRSLGAQSPRVSEDRNKTPDISEMPDEDTEPNCHSDEDGAKTPQPENILTMSQSESVQSIQDELSTSSTSSKQQSRDSGFVGSCDDLLLQPPRSTSESSRTLSEASSGVLDTRDSVQTKDNNQAREKDKLIKPPSEERNIHERILDSQRLRERLASSTGGSLTRKDSFNNWSSDEETNLMMSKMRQFFKTMVASSNNVNPPGSTASSAASPAPSPSPRLSGYSSKTTNYVQAQNRTKPPQLVYFENELTRLMKTVPGIRDEQVREIVEYLSSEDTWSDSYDSSDYTSSDLEGATAGGRRSALQEQISASCQQIINKFDSAVEDRILPDRRDVPIKQTSQQNMGRDTAFVYQKLVQSFTKMAGDNVASDASSTPHSSPPLIAKVMHHIGSRLVALMHEVSESNSSGGHSHTSAGWRRYPHHRAPSSASTTEDDDSTSDSASASALPRSKSHDPLHLNGHAGAASMPPVESEERGEASDYERFSWRGSFESALMAADSRTKLSLLACSGGDVSSSTMAMAAKRRSAGDLLFNHKSFSREQLDRVRSCGSIGGAGNGNVSVGASAGGSIEEKIWSNRRRSSVPDANTRGESGASAGDEDTGDDSEDLDYANHGDPRATTLPRGVNPTVSMSGTTNSLPRQTGLSGAAMLKAHHFTQHTSVKSARYRPPGFTRNSPGALAAAAAGGPKRAFSAPGLQLQSRSRRMANTSATSSNNLSNTSGSADEASLSEACSTPIIGASSRIANASHASMDLDEIDRNLHLATRASLSSLGARSDSMASVYSGAGEGRWCGSVAVRGEVEFSLQYDYKQLTLEVHVTQCKDLAPVDVKRNRSDPYVKVYLLPDKSKSGKRKTKVKKHTLNPVFDETLKFHTSLNSLETRTLWLTVWHSDMFGRNDFLGEVRMPLENKIFDDPRPQWHPLQERTEPFDDPVAYKGEVIVGLKFVPPDPTRLDRERDMLSLTNKLKKSFSKGSLHVLVKEARNLQTRAKNSGTCDPFCKSYLLPDKGRSGKQKTGVVRRSSGSPVWNHTFVYKDVSLQELAERGLELTVWDHDRIASNEFLGGVRFNLGTGKHYGKGVDWMDATGREMSLWQNMLERPNFWVEGAVTLRPNLHNHVKTGTY